MNWTQRIVITALLGFSLNGAALAAALGLPNENTARIGYLVGMDRFSVDDPDGPSEDVVDVLPLTLIYTDWLPHGWRYWAEAYYFSTSLDGNAGDIRQNVRRIGARLALQHNVHLGEWSLWIGAGLDVSQNRYTNRYSVDNNGSLLNGYANRSDTVLGITMQIISEWPLAQDWDLAAKFEHVFPESGDITETSLSAGVLYRY